MFNYLDILTPSEKELNDMKLRYRLADGCLEACSYDLSRVNEFTFAALTHLAMIKNLNIDMSKYEQLQYGGKPDFESYRNARDLLNQLAVLIQEKEIEIYEELYK